MSSLFGTRVATAAAGLEESSGAQPPARCDASTSSEAVARLAAQASGIGRQAAELNGLIDDLARDGGAHSAAIHQLAGQIDQVVEAARGIDRAADTGRAHVGQARVAVRRVGESVGSVVDTLRQVAVAADAITQIALQTRLVAFSASVEAKRAGEAGRGFGALAEAVKELAAKVEQSSKLIMSTISQLDKRVSLLAQEISGCEDGSRSAFQRALASAEHSVDQIAGAARANLGACLAAGEQMRAMAGEVAGIAGQLGGARATTLRFLDAAESLVKLTIETGVETEDSPFIRSATAAPNKVSSRFSEPVRDGLISQDDLFDQNYVPFQGTDPK